MPPWEITADVEVFDAAERRQAKVPPTGVVAAQERAEGKRLECGQTGVPKARKLTRRRGEAGTKDGNAASRPWMWMGHVVGPRQFGGLGHHSRARGIGVDPDEIRALGLDRRLQVGDLVARPLGECFTCRHEGTKRRARFPILERYRLDARVDRRSGEAEPLDRLHASARGTDETSCPRSRRAIAVAIGG